MDYRIVGNFCLEKKDRKRPATDLNWLKEFELDSNSRRRERRDSRPPSVVSASLLHQRDVAGFGVVAASIPAHHAEGRQAYCNFDTRPLTAL